MGRKIQVFAEQQNATPPPQDSFLFLPHDVSEPQRGSLFHNPGSRCFMVTNGFSLCRIMESLKGEEGALGYQANCPMVGKMRHS
jgi:hypothetical protein